MQDQDIINEEERLEAATEEPTTLGCPSLVPKVLPSGFDGVEPGEDVKDKGRIVIEHNGKKYGVDDFEVVDGFFNDHIQVTFGMCICPKCGCDRAWIMAKELA